MMKCLFPKESSLEELETRRKNDLVDHPQHDRSGGGGIGRGKVLKRPNKVWKAIWGRRKKRSFAARRTRRSGTTSSASTSGSQSEINPRSWFIDQSQFVVRDDEEGEEEEGVAGGEPICQEMGEEGEVLQKSSSKEVTIDPILLTRINVEKEPTFVYTRPNGTTKVTYRVESLVDYMLFTGKFSEPETGLCFTDTELQALDRLVAENHLEKKSVLEAKHNPAEFANRDFNSTALVGLERCCGEVIGQIPDILESSDSKEIAQVVLLTEIFPSIRHYYEQMVASNYEYAIQSLEQYISFIKGPPNCPVYDPNHLLPSCMNFLEELRHLSQQCHQIHQIALV